MGCTQAPSGCPHISCVEGKVLSTFREVAQAEEVLPENRLLEMMGMDKDTHFSYRENMALIDILLEFHVEVELSPSAITNMAVGDAPDGAGSLYGRPDGEGKGKRD